MRRGPRRPSRTAAAVARARSASHSCARRRRDAALREIIASKQAVIEAHNADVDASLAYLSKVVWNKEVRKLEDLPNADPEVATYAECGMGAPADYACASSAVLGAEGDYALAGDGPGATDAIYAFAAEGAKRQQVVEDLMWVLINSAEFVFNH